MGLFDSIREAKAAIDGLTSGDAHWAKILRVEAKSGRRVELTLEIHDQDLPVFQRTMTDCVPKGCTAEVGQDIFVKQQNGQYAGMQIPYNIDWKRPPQYGAPEYDPQAAGDAMVKGMMTQFAKDHPETPLPPIPPSAAPPAPPTSPPGSPTS